MADDKQLRVRVVREGRIRADDGGDGDDLPTRLTMVVATDAPVRFYGIDEVLGMKRDECDLGRFANSAPFLRDHSNRIESILGVIEKAKIAKLDEGRGLVAEVRLADTDEARAYAKLVRDGMAGKISVGFTVRKWEREREGTEHEPPLYRAVSWEPQEASAVAVPADDGAKVQEFRYLPDDEGGETPRNTGARAMADEVKTEPKADQTPAEMREAVAKATAQARDNAAAMLAIGETYEKRGCEGAQALANQAIREGKPESWLRGEIEGLLDKRLEDLAASNAERREALNVGMSDKEAKSFSLVRLVRHLTHPNNKRYAAEAGLELEACAEARKINQAIEGRASVGDLSLPGEYYTQPIARSAAEAAYIAGKMRHRAVNVGVGGTNATVGAANLVETALLDSSFIEFLYNQAALAGRVRPLDGLVGNVDIPRRTASATTSWVEESTAADASDSDSAYDEVTLTPRKMHVSTLISHTALLQTTPGIEALTRADHAMSKLLKLDGGILFGDKADAKEPTGITETDDIITVSGADANGIALGIDRFHELYSRVGAENALMPDHVTVMNYNMRFKLQTLPRLTGATDGESLWNGGMPFGFPAVVSNQLPSETRGTSGANGTSRLIVCSPNNILLGTWGSDDILVDPYTQRQKGFVRLSCIAHHDVAVRLPKTIATRRYVIHA